MKTNQEVEQCVKFTRIMRGQNIDVKVDYKEVDGSVGYFVFNHEDKPIAFLGSTQGSAACEIERITDTIRMYKTVGECKRVVSLLVEDPASQQLSSILQTYGFRYRIYYRITATGSHLVAQINESPTWIEFAQNLTEAIAKAESLINSPDEIPF